MLHPYSIFFKAMWWPQAATDDAVPERTRLMRWRLWWSDTVRRQHAADRRAAGTAASTSLTSTPAEAPRGGIAG